MKTQDSTKTSIRLNQSGQRPAKSRLAKLIIGTAVGVVALLGFGAYSVLTNTFTPQWFLDQVTVANYQPSEGIEKTVFESGMNEHGRFMFYTAEPQIEEREDFNYHCAALLNELSNILGCYDGRIYLFDITDQRIEGVENVTAAHEMLHAAYDRLSLFEKIKVDTMVEEQLAATTDPDILELVEMYSQTEPGQEINELHSIFGTEVRELLPDLENYYARYFADRMKVVEQNEKYNTVFKQMEQRAEELEQKMTDLNQEINNLTTEYYAAVAELDQEVAAFNQRASTYGGFSGEAAFYAQRSLLAARQGRLENMNSDINAKISEYNGYVGELQAIGREAEELQNNIDSQAGGEDIL